jgi:cobalt-zinc-cadmium efflux system outer membrane protein
MRSDRVAVLAVLAVPLLVRAAFAAEATGLTLEGAVALALRNNPDLRAREQDRAATAAAETTAALRPNPTLSNETQDFTFGVGQLLERGGKRERRMESARLGTAVAEGDLADARRQLVLEVRTTFVAALLARSNLDLARANLADLVRVEDLQKVRFDAGEVSQGDVVRLQLQRMQFESDVETAELAESAARSTLRRLLGDSGLAADFTVQGTLHVPSAHAELSDLLGRAQRSRPDLQSAAAAVKKGDADERLARANATADPSVTVGWGHTGAAAIPSEPWLRPGYSTGPRDNWLGFGVSVPLRIFDRNQGEIARARAAAEGSVWRLDAARRQVASDVEQAFAVWRASTERAARFESTFRPQSSELRQIAEFAFAKGATSVLDLLDAVRTDRGVELAYRQALADANTHLFELEAAIGEDLEPAP